MTYQYLKVDWRRGKTGSGSRRKAAGWLLVAGVVSWLLVAVPLVRYQFSYASEWMQFLTPVGEEVESGGGGGEEVTEGVADSPTTLREVFPEVAENYQQVEGVEYYRLSIPKLRIKDAKVKVGGEDLSESLVHYGGTALPGKIGNGVVFGHSVLPQFFNPENYMAIFSTLHTLKAGDGIRIDFDGIEYRYQIVKIFVVDPKDFGVLEQDEDASYLTLITCTPPGTYLKRLVVKAKLMPWG